MNTDGVLKVFDRYELVRICSYWRAFPLKSLLLTCHFRTLIGRNFLKGDANQQLRQWLSQLHGDTDDNSGFFGNEYSQKFVSNKTIVTWYFFINIFTTTWLFQLPRLLQGWHLEQDRHSSWYTARCDSCHAIRNTASDECWGYLISAEAHCKANCHQERAGQRDQPWRLLRRYGWWVCAFARFPLLASLIEEQQRSHTVFSLPPRFWLTLQS